MENQVLQQILSEIKEINTRLDKFEDEIKAIKKDVKFAHDVAKAQVAAAKKAQAILKTHTRHTENLNIIDD